ncbi:neprilysin-4-like [Musca domestica]|uniref:Neprilysin-4-like n=1 Tax=Musca domestica TaxID=7370 RepID=A0A9J7D1K8_MUSDO|nr:neprilysin-4-like [Musca domestica]XP_058980161.1 neprilysin-4-like [Musca domestica]
MWGIGILAVILWPVVVLSASVDLFAGIGSRLQKGSEMLKYMNMSVDPCEDFYEFTCGNWNRYHSAASGDTTTTGLLENLQKSLSEKLMEILVTPEREDTKVDRKVKDFYRSCLNLGALKNDYAHKLRELIGEFGQMPALAGAAWQEERFDWLEVVAKIAYKYGIGILTPAEVSGDLVDDRQNRLYLRTAELSLGSRNVYLDKGSSQLLQGITIVVYSRLSDFLDMEVELAKRTAKEIIDFEIALARGIDDINSVSDYREVIALDTIDALEQKYAGQLDIKKLMYLSFGTLPNLRVYSNPKYIKHLIELMRTTPRRIVANYIFYNLIKKFLVEVPKTETKLQKNCLKGMKPHFFKIFDNIIYRRFMSREIEQGIHSMWEEIKHTFKLTLASDKYQWIDAVTRLYAIEKVKAMKMDIVSYKNYDFQAAFGDLNVNDHDYVENLKSLHALASKRHRESITKPPKPLELGEELSISPANVLNENMVKVPVSMLQPYQVWSTQFPNAFNYAVLGALLSHELIHGFDDAGRGYDINGKPLQWWDLLSSIYFKERSQCFNEQYHGYVFQNRRLPYMSQDENIADNGGVRLAYNAYLNWYREAEQKNPQQISETMPGLNFSDKKLFFVSYGQLWCGDINPLIRQFQESTDAHVPDKFRVIGPLSNFDEFSKVFECRPGSGMNPIKKCEIY